MQLPLLTPTNTLRQFHRRHGSSLRNNHDITAAPCMPTSGHSAVRQCIDEFGYTWSDPLAHHIISHLETICATSTHTSTPALPPKPVEPIEAVLTGTPLHATLCTLLGPEVRLRRALLMDKREGHNWELGMHQDTTVAVAEPMQVEGFHSWVHKGSWYHAQAPEGVMRQVLTTRIHLDDVPEDNGALLVLPGSHRYGVLTPALKDGLMSTGVLLTLPAQRGDVMLMSPLLLHGSGRAVRPSSRRVLHMEWTAQVLPGGLQWAWL